VPGLGHELTLCTEQRQWKDIRHKYAEAEEE